MPIKCSEGKDEIWEFIRTPKEGDEPWTWHREVNGVVDRRSQDKFVRIGSAIVDAMRNGFVPIQHSWVVTDKDARTYFAPGTEPRTVRRG